MTEKIIDINKIEISDERDKQYSIKNKLFNYEFYITNLDYYSSKEKVRNEFLKLGEIKELTVKKSKKNNCYLAFVKLKGNIISTGSVIEDFYKRNGWRISLDYREENEMFFLKKPKRHICGRKYLDPITKKSQTSNSNINNKKVTHSRSRSRSRLRSISRSQSKIKSDEIENKKKTRELWISNFPINVTEQELWNAFFIYGEIERIDLFLERRYALIRFFLCSSAIKALKSQKTKLFRSRTLIMAFSDSNRNSSIIGDKEGYEPKEENCTIIHLTLPKGCKIPSESQVKDFFSNYGKLRGWNINQDPPNIYIDFEKPESANNVRVKLMNGDLNDIKQLIGDHKCNVNSLFKDSQKELGNMSTGGSSLIMGPDNTHSGNLGNNTSLNLASLSSLMNLNNGNNHLLDNNLLLPLLQSSGNNNLINGGGLIESLNTLKLLQILQANQNTNLKSNNPNMNCMNNLNQSNDSILNPLLMNIIAMQNNPLNMNNPLNNQISINKSFNTLSNMPYYINSNLTTIPNNLPQFNMYQDYNNFVNPYLPYNNLPTNINGKNIPKNSLHNPELKAKLMNLNQTIKNSNSSHNLINENEYSLESENLKTVWSGDLSKNNKDRLSVIAYQLRNECKEFLKLENNLNIEHRTMYEDVLKRPHKGIMVFSPMSEAHHQIFDDYINYFNKRERVGIAYLKNNVDIVYILSPNEFSKKFYLSPKKHLLGIIVDKKIQQETNLTFSLPTPIISNSEKFEKKNLYKDLKSKNSIKK